MSLANPKIMQMALIFKFRFLILFHGSHLDGGIYVKLPLQNKITRFGVEFVPQHYRGAVTADHRCQPVECTPNGGRGLGFLLCGDR